MSTVRIFSTLILLALDRFGEPIRMKHSHINNIQEKEKKRRATV